MTSPPMARWQVLYGEKDAPAHDFSQMCVVVPPAAAGGAGPARRWRLQAGALRCCGPAGGQYGAPRFQVAQPAKPRNTPCRSDRAVAVAARRSDLSGGARSQVVQVGSYALLNIHPGPARPGDPVPEVLGEAAAQLLQQPGVRAVHIVGDWNRPAAQWAVPPRFA